MTPIPTALMMMTVREEAEKDYMGTVRRVSEIGYRAIQSHYGICDPAELRKTTDDLGMKVVGIHTPITALQNELSKVMACAHTMGCIDVTCPYLPEEYRGREGYPKAGRVLSEAGQKLRESGFRLTYHNHAFEFEEIDGKLGFDLMFENADPDALLLEPDIYWLVYGHQDPLEYLERFSGRTPLLHIKDMEPGEERFFAEIGEGIIEWPPIFEAGAKAGAEWAIVEQDLCRRPPMESARLSFENLKSMGLAG